MTTQATLMKDIDPTEFVRRLDNLYQLHTDLRLAAEAIESTDATTAHEGFQLLPEASIETFEERIEALTTWAETIRNDWRAYRAQAAKAADATE